LFSKDEIVMYTTYGICRITDVFDMKLGGMTKQYYKLVPLSEAKTELALPVDNPTTFKRLHPLLSKTEITEIINEIPYLEPYWIDRDNDRKNEFSDVIKSGDRKETLRVVKSIKKHILDIKDKGRKLHATDEQAMKDAMKLILDEFSYVLEKDRQELNAELDIELTPKEWK